MIVRIDVVPPVLLVLSDLLDLTGQLRLRPINWKSTAWVPLLGNVLPAVVVYLYFREPFVIVLQWFLTTFPNYGGHVLLYMLSKSLYFIPLHFIVSHVHSHVVLKNTSLILMRLYLLSSS